MRTVVALAELPPLTVWLGPPLLAPVVELPPCVPPPLLPLPPLAVDGADDPPVGATVVLGAVVTGAALEPVVLGVVLLLGVVPWSLLLQPDRRAMAAAADDTAIRATREELITAA